MLVLTRKLRESITIGDDVRITVVDIRGRQVKLAIEAPREVAVHRTEVFDRIQRENGTGSNHVHPGIAHPPVHDDAQARLRRGPERR